MRLLLVSNGYPPEAAAGVELHTQQLAEALAGRLEAAVFCREGDPSAAEFRLRHEIVGGLPVWRVNNNFLDVTDYAGYYRRPESEALFRRVLAEWRPDAVHFQHALGLSAALPEIARAAGVPAVLTLHDFWFICPTVQLLNARGEVCPGTHHGANCFECVGFADPRWAAWRRRRLFRLAAGWVPARWKPALAAGVQALRGRPAPSGPPAPQIPTAGQAAQIAARVASMRQALAAPQVLTAPSTYVRAVYEAFGAAAGAIRVIPLGLDVARWRRVARRPSPDGAVRALYLGGRQAHKGVLVALAAFRRLAGAGHRLSLHGVPGLDPQVAAQVQAGLAEDPRAEWRGLLPHAALAERLAETDVLLAPALWPETFSFVVREALLAGVWVIASDLGALREVVQPGRNGWLVPPGDVDAWASALEALAAAVAAGRTPAPPEFPALSHAEYADAMLDLYAAVRGGR